MSLNLTSSLANDMLSMINFKVAMGYSKNTYFYHCKSFDRFCNDCFPTATELTEEIVLGWLQIQSGELNVLHQRASFIRTFSKYICSIGKHAYILPDKFIPSQKPFMPYILTDKELSELFNVIDNCPHSQRLDALQPSLFSTIFRLIYTCGLRPHEGRILLCKNVNLSTGEILINSSKKHKDRVVVMSDDMKKLAQRYSELRGAIHPDSPYFFPSKKGVPYTVKMLDWHFKNFVASANPNVKKELLPNVRIYDLRHRFATTVSMKWIDENRNFYSMLPYLSTYMGHAKLSYTAYYIHLLPENLKKSQSIDWAAMGSLLPEVESWGK